MAMENILAIGFVEDHAVAIDRFGFSIKEKTTKPYNIGEI
jgi:hypothetical protein